MRFGATSARPQWLFVGLGLAIVVATYGFLVSVGSAGLSQSGLSGSNQLIAIAGYVIGAALIIWGVSRQFTTSTYALIPIAIAINVVIGQIVRVVKLPLYLDSIGTVLVGVLVGPWAGAATGGLSNVVAGLTVDPVSLPFAVVAIVIGLLAGVWTRIGWMRRLYLAPLAGAITGVIAGLMSAPLAAFIYNGVTGTGQDALVAGYLALTDAILPSTILQSLTSDPLDKLISFTLVYLIIVAMPARLRARFNQGSNVSSKLPQ